MTVPVLPALPLVGSAVAAPNAAPKYVVLKGDYLVGIASKLQVTLPALLKSNSLTVSSVIVPGQQLVVPAGGVLPPPAPAGSTATPPVKVPVSTVAASSTKYTVKNGDFLYGIATKLKVKIGDLLTVNGFKVTTVINPGQQILVPATAVFPTQVSNTVSGNGSGGSVSSSPPAGSQAAARIATVVAYAQAQLGKPYVAYKAGPDSFDCSGLTLMAYKTVGINLPHWSVAQALKGVPVDWVNGEIQAGDLVFTSHTNDVNAINHVGIAVDSRRWIQAPRTGDVVRIGLLPSDDKIVAVRRIILP